ncbi:uncharacterized protein LOC142929373 isoform X1 [Petromyzon marinus]|uniref:uncharacterized protein LOC142929373 isoform X1 n=1 Tax=Petromyzon marinus TaxID=7757 RepID=UPI003F72643C
MSTQLHTHTHVYTTTHTGPHNYTHTCPHNYTHTCPHNYTHTGLHNYTHTCPHNCTHTHMSTQLHTHTHVYTTTHTGLHNCTAHSVLRAHIKAPPPHGRGGSRGRRAGASGGRLSRCCCTWGGGGRGGGWGRRGRGGEEEDEVVGLGGGATNKNMPWPPSVPMFADTVPPRESAPIIPSPTTGQRASTPRLAALCFRHFIKMQIRRYGDVRGSSSPPQRASRGLDRGVWISRRCVMLGCCAKCHSRFLHQLFPGLQCSSSLGEWATPLFGAETRVDIHASFDCAASSRDRARLPSPSAPPPSDANGGWLQSPGNVGRR